VQIKTNGGRTVRAYLVYPQIDKPVLVVLAVVVIHENRGLNDWARGVADQLAQAGYVALAPDLLSATGPGGGGTESYPSSDAAREGIYKLLPEQVLDDLDAATAYVRALKSTTDVVAVAGFCWGGGQTFRYAAHNPDIAAAFVFYGPAPDADSMKTIKAPVYGFYGGNDHRISAAVLDTEKTMRELGKTYAAVVYDGVGHGFMRSGEASDADPANKEARAQGWERWKMLLGRL
jgi:carboxymethylenebutenolidase